MWKTIFLISFYKLFITYFSLCICGKLFVKCVYNYQEKTIGKKQDMGYYS